MVVAHNSGIFFNTHQYIPVAGSQLVSHHEGSGNFFCKKPHGKYLQATCVYVAYSLFTLAFVFNNPLKMSKPCLTRSCTKTGHQLDLGHRPWFADHWDRELVFLCVGKP